MSGEDALKSKEAGYPGAEDNMDDVGEDGPMGEEGPPGGLDMAALQGMMGGMGGEGGEGGAGGMDMSALMSMLGGKGGGKGGMGDMMGGMGGKGGGKGQPEAKDDTEKAGDGGKYHWQQKGEEVQIRFPMEVKVNKKEIVVKFKRASLNVTIKGEVVLDGALGGGVEVDECTWCIAPDGMELQVMLTKQDEADWRSLLA